MNLGNNSTRQTSFSFVIALFVDLLHLKYHNLDYVLTQNFARFIQMHMVLAPCLIGRVEYVQDSVQTGNKVRWVVVLSYRARVVPEQKDLTQKSVRHRKLIEVQLTCR